MVPGGAFVFMVSAGRSCWSFCGDDLADGGGLVGGLVGDLLRDGVRGEERGDGQVVITNGPEG